MDFDPNQYLAEKSAPKQAGFDPSAYLSDHPGAKDLVPHVIQEQHPEFSNADRLIANNFSSTPQDAVGYLQKRHPNMEIAVDPESQQIRARGKNESAYRVLNPNVSMDTLTDVPEMLKIAGSHAYDLASGVGTAYATAAAGLGAGLGTGGTMALPAAAAAGAGASSAAETLRQAIGKYGLGMENNFDPTSIGIAGAGGALSPLLLGTGGTVASSLGKKIVGGGLDEAGQAALQAAQRGGLSRAYDALGKPVVNAAGGFLSGVGKSAMDTLTNNYPKVMELMNAPTGVRQFAQDTGKMINDKVFAKTNDLHRRFKDAIGAAGDSESIDLAPVQQLFKDEIVSAEDQMTRGKGTEVSKELLDNLKEQYNKIFMHDVTEKVPTTVMKPNGLLDAAGQPMMTPSTEVAEQTVRKSINKLTPEAAVDLGTSLNEMANFQALGANAGNRFSTAASAAEKKIQQVGAKLKNALDDTMDKSLPPGTLDIRREYGQARNLSREATDLMQTPQQTFTNLRNADNTSNLAKKQLFQDMDTTFGTNLLDRAKLMETMEQFSPGRKSVFSADLLRRVPAGLLGGAAGYYAGENSPLGAHAGGLAGAAAGMALGGPSAMRRYIGAGKGLSNLFTNSGVAPNVVGSQQLQAPINSAWQLLQQRGQ